MFKKTLVAAVILAASSSALASGFYAGAGIGADNVNNKADITNNGSVNYGATGVLGGLFAGYQYNFANSFNLGAEAFANATSTNMTDNSYEPNGDSAVKFKQTYSYGARILPGYNITPYIEAHAIAGFVRGHFQTTLDSSQKYNANGFQAGLGASAMATKTIAIRGDLIYSGYKSHTTTDVDGDTFQSKVHTVDAILSAMYKFG
ncbi:MAG: hypothetical protein K0S08_929 [Gammaproteobacteria bacterium]|jgi:opacity protein-like surface antigen|nr:hypothetical protein [Gammaproteobacteria bacterium]